MSPKIEAKSAFKVIIGGGSITGLTLANMLQSYDVDFLVLESYPDIAPQVGASIGILPHGQRILDQLGLHQKINALAPPLDSFHFRDHAGNIICEFRGMVKSMYERHGYPITFLDRQMVLQVLYDNIKDKSKVLTSKRVQHVELSRDKVHVKTADGSIYEGDILVGADGIHSTVRKEMWRIADQMHPGWIPADEKQAVPCDYACVFGISNPCYGIEPGASNSVFKKHKSYILNGGPGGRVYWFYFFKLPERAYGDKIPVYTKEDEEKILKSIEDDDITPNMKFKKVIEEKISSVLVPLQEYVFRQWHYDRIIAIGDASHKFHPIAGHGGNACIESAAVLVNELVKQLKSCSPAKPSLLQVHQAFATTQQVRQDRTTTLKEHSHEQQRSELLDTRLHEFAAFHLLPRTDTEDVTFFFSRNMPLAERLDDRELVQKPKLIPFKDELLSAPKPRGKAKWAFIGFYLLVATAVHYGMWVWSVHYNLGDHVGAIVKTGIFPDDSTFPLKRKYIGIRFIDDYLVFLAVAYMPGLNNWNKSFGMLQMYFLGMLVQPIAIWTVEAFRKRNAMTPVAMITIWLTFVQWAGVGIYMPIFYAAYTFISEPETYWWPLNREVPIAFSSSLLWANIVGYVVPTIVMFIPWSSPYAVQNFEALWQASPMFVPLLCHILSYFYIPPNSDNQAKQGIREFTDVGYLKNIYIVTGALGLLLHVFCAVKISASNDVTWASVFWPDFSPQPKPLGEGLRAIFMADFWGFYIATYVWLCMAVWDVKRVGRTAVDVAKASILIAVGNLIIGPGTTMSAVWYWRENALAQQMFPRV